MGVAVENAYEMGTSSRLIWVPERKGGARSSMYDYYDSEEEEGEDMDQGYEDACLRRVRGQRRGNCIKVAKMHYRQGILLST